MATSEKAARPAATQDGPAAAAPPQGTAARAAAALSRQGGVAGRRWTPRVDGEVLSRLAARAAVADRGATFALVTPLTGEECARVPEGTPGDIAAAAAASREAQSRWAATPFAERGRVLLRFHDLVLSRRDEILDIIQLETGKARRHAFEEVMDVAIWSRFYARTAEGFLRPRRRQGVLPLLTAAWELHHPRGVIGFVTPWNYPLNMSFSDAVPALMAGNGAVIKPDSQTPFTCLWAAELLERAGLPRGLVQVVPGRGSLLGEPLIAAADYLMFTGSTATGRTVAGHSAAQLKDCSMELGGKNPLLVLPDADLPRAVAGAARGIIANGGQQCVHPERIYVPSRLYEPFCEALVATLRRVKLGASFTYADDMGSLAGEAQLSRVTRHVEDAVAKGARVLTGGRPRPDVGPYFYEPTLLAGVDETMDACRDETFGPVAAVYPCSSVDDMVRRANDSEYGLNASVWTRDTRQGRAVAARLQAGTVNVNEAYAAAFVSAGPQGGFKQSGMGRRHARQGIVKYTEAQTVAVERLLALDTPPFLTHAQYAAVMPAVLRLLSRVPGYDRG